MIVPLIESGLEARLKLGLVLAAPVSVAPSGPGLIGETETLASELAHRHAGKAPAEIDDLRAARDLYKSFGVDPTRTRPSSEALLRRVIGGKPLPRVSNAVDVANLSSLRFLLPLGLYDTAKIQGGVAIRTGGAGESYPGIRKDDVHVDGRIVLADDAGPFGNPTSDSLRTCVDGDTRSLWMVIFAPAWYPTRRLEEHVGFARSAMERHLAGSQGPVRSEGLLLP